MSAPSKEAVLDCVEFVAGELAGVLLEADRIEAMQPEARPDLQLEAERYAMALGRTQSIAFNIRVRLEFLESELRRCLPRRGRS